MFMLYNYCMTDYYIQNLMLNMLGRPFSVHLSRMQTRREGVEIASPSSKLIMNTVYCRIQLYISICRPIGTSNR